MSGRVLVIGGGLAGLSAAWHLGKDAVLLEGTAEVGGLCRSYERDGYVFDMSGHLLHFRRPVISRFVRSLVPRLLVRHCRRAYVHFRGRLIDYPFQAHLFQLPEKVRQECLEGFLQAQDRREWSDEIVPADFAGWIRHSFGPGIARHFMEPYNRKLWQVPLTQLTAEWASWAVPVPTADEIRAAAEDPGEQSFGYNPVFFYPRKGGIGSLARAMADGVVRLHLEEKAVEIDLARRRVTTAQGRKFPFEHLVSTVPLPLLLRMIKGISPSVAEAGEKLRCVPVCIFNVGLSRPGPAEPHWIYFPGKSFPFYRVGFTHNFAPSSAPEGCQSLYVEVSRRPDAKEGCRSLWPSVQEGLVRAGIMKKGEKPSVLDVIHVPYAYVLYDRHRATVIRAIRGILRQSGVYPIGRYGAWEYSAMEDAIFQGRESARRLRRRL
jgi:protoporphyrinogen oxidase